MRHLAPILFSTALSVSAMAWSPTTTLTTYESDKTSNVTYPAVWGYEFPWRKENERGLQINVQSTGNNDFAITYLTSLGVTNGKAYASYSGLLFFSGKPLSTKSSSPRKQFS